MIRYIVDLLPVYLTGNIVSGDSSSLNLIDQNPSNPYTWTTATVTMDFELDFTYSVNPQIPAAPINGFALFGISKSLMGANLVIQKRTSTSTYTQIAELDIGFDRVWIPLNEIGYPRQTISLSTPTRSYRIIITKPVTGTYSIGEISAGLIETIGLNYQYGRNRTQESLVDIQTTIGGVDWVYLKNAIPRNLIDLSWGDITIQDIESLRIVYKKTNRGLDPLVLLLDDLVRSGFGSCFYGRLDPNFQDVEDFFNLYSKTLTFSEAISYEEP